MLKHSALNSDVALRTGDQLLKDRDYLMHPATYRLQEKYPFLQRDRQYVFAQVKRDPSRLKFSKPFSDDIGIVLAAIQQDAMSLEYAGENAKNNMRVAWTAINSDSDSFKYLGTKTRKSKQLTLSAISKGSNLNGLISPRLRDDIDITGALIKSGRSLRFVGKHLHHNKDLMFRAIANSSHDSLKFASTELKRDKMFVQAALKQDGRALKYADSRFKDDETMVWLAMKTYWQALEDASERLRKDKNFNLYSIQTYGGTHALIHPSLKSDPEIIQALLENKNGLTLEGAGKVFTNNRTLALELISAGKIGQYRYFSETLRDDKFVIMAALEKAKAIKYEFTLVNDEPIRFASTRLKQDREVALASIRLVWDLFDVIHPKFRRDKEIILTSLKEFYWYRTHTTDHFKYIDKKLLEDKEIANALLKADGGSFSLLAEKLRNDRDMLKKAVRNIKAYSYDERFVASVPTHLLNDRGLMIELAEYFYKYLKQSFQADRE